MPNNNVIVIYGSKYGFSEKYAKWLSEDLGCKAVSCDKAAVGDFTGKDAVVYIGGLYAGSIRGIKLLVKNSAALSGKKLVVVSCGLSSPDDEVNVNNIRAAVKKALPEDLSASFKHFHLRGGIDYSNISFFHKLMMSMLIKIIAKKPDPTPDDKAMLDTYGKKVDLTDRKALKPIEEYVMNGD